MGIQERKDREKLQRRNDIIDSAEQLFFKHGLGNVSMDHIAQEAELSKGTLYLYFKGREDLHYAVVNRGLDLLNEIIQRNHVREASGADNLLQLGRSYIDFSREHPGHFQSMMLFDASSFEKVDKEQSLKILEPGSPLMFLIEIVKTGQEDGSVRNDISPEKLAMILWSHLSSILELITLRGPLLNYLEVDKGSIIDAQFEISLNGVLSK